MKLAIDPLAIVCWFALAVVKDSFPVDLILLEIAFIESAIFEFEASLTMFHSIQGIPLIEMTFCISKFAINLIILNTF